MPIEDMTGAAANMIGVQRGNAALGRARNAQIVSGASQLGGSLVDYAAKTKMHEQLVAAGFDEPTATSLVASGPHAAASALIQKMRDVQQRQQQTEDVAGQRAYQTERDERNFGQQKELAEYTQGLGEQADEASRTRFTDTLAATGPKVGFDPNMPAIPNLPPFAQRPQNREELTKSLGGVKGGPDPTVAKHALGQMDKGFPDYGAAADDALGRQYKRAQIGKMEAEANAPPPVPAPRNIDPLSPEGIAAQKELGRGADRFPDAVRARATLLRGYISAINNTLQKGDEIVRALGQDPDDLRTQLQQFQTEYDRIAPPVAEQNTTVDPALKAEFDGFPPERQQSLLEQMTPEQKAKIGR